MQWAQSHNEEVDKHFPILAIGYGMTALMKSQTDDDTYMDEVPQGENLQINLAHEPMHTYLFDEFEAEKLEKMLDNVFFYSDVAYGVSMMDFVTKAKTLSQIFIPVASYNDDNAKNSNEETVAVIEGVIYPWFGISYRIDRV